MTYREQLDAGAKALREFEMGDRIKGDWSSLPKSQTRKWWAKAAVVLNAAGINPPNLSASEVHTNMARGG